MGGDVMVRGESCETGGLRRGTVTRLWSGWCYWCGIKMMLSRMSTWGEGDTEELSAVREKLPTLDNGDLYAKNTFLLDTTLLLERALRKMYAPVLHHCHEHPHMATPPLQPARQRPISGAQMTLARTEKLSKSESGLFVSNSTVWQMYDIVTRH